MDKANGSEDAKGAQDLSFELFIPQMYPWEVMKEGVERAEGLGFEKMWVADHFVSPVDPASDWFEAWTLLPALAAVTDLIRLGTLVTSITFRNPAVLARQALTLDHISGGRLQLGLGAGGARNCHTMTGVPLWEKRERVDRFGEFVEIVDAMLRNEKTTYEGTYYQVQEAMMQPAPVQQPRPPLTIAAHGARTLGIAARYADTWSSYYPGPDLSPEEGAQVIRELNDRLSEFASEIDRDPAEIRRSFAVGYTTDTPFVSEDAFQDFVGRFWEAGIQEFVLGYAPGLDRPGFEGKWITEAEMLTRVAQDWIPTLKSG